jgi:adenylate kinase family enzyme
VLYLEGPEDVMVQRLKGRGRSDDNEETIKKRLRVNQRDAEPVVAYFDKAKKLVRVNCNDTPEGRNFKITLTTGVYSQILVQIQAIIEGWER